MLTLIKRIILFFSLLIPINANAIVNQTYDFYVNDSANVLSQETEKYIVEKSSSLYKYNGSQIVVVTVKDLEGMSIETYATTLFNNWKIGDKEKNNGLLLLLALNEREFRVEVGSGLEGILPDGKTGRYQDNYLIPYLKENKWDDGIKSLYDAFYNDLSSIENIEEYTPADFNKLNKSITTLIIIIIIFIIFIKIKFNDNPLISSYGRGFSSRSYRDFGSSGSFSSHSSGGFSGGGRSSGGGSTRRF